MANKEVCGSCKQPFEKYDKKEYCKSCNNDVHGVCYNRREQLCDTCLLEVEKLKRR